MAVILVKSAIRGPINSIHTHCFDKYQTLVMDFLRAFLVAADLSFFKDRVEKTNDEILNN